MQVYAFDKNQNRVFVETAKSGCDYYCLECKQTVRKRGGAHMQLHFFHLHPDVRCRQNGKSKTHIAIQRYLIRLLGENCQEEALFAEINRIADVAWFEKKIIFEVQCSPITADEVRTRQRDYEKAGFCVVWILHAKEFCKKKVSAAYAHLQKHPHYIADYDFITNECISDFCPIICNDEKKGAFLWRSIDLSKIQKREYVLPSKALPLCMQKRQAHWNLFVRDDLLDEVNQGKTDLFRDALQFEMALLQQKTEKKRPLRRLGQFFKAIYYYLIEQNTR